MRDRCPSSNDAGLFITTRGTIYFSKAAVVATVSHFFSTSGYACNIITSKMLLGSGNDHERKRKSETEGSAPIEEVTRKRPTRFADQGSGTVGVAAIAAAAKAAEIARSINVKLPSNVGEYGSQQQSATSQETASRLARAAEMQAELSAQIASVASLFSNVQQAGAVPVDRKPTYRPLLLDALGREIDEYGQVVKTTVAKSLAANVAVERELKKKENPYLIHQRVPVRAAPLGPPGVAAALLPSSVPGSVVLSEDQGYNEQIDERIVASNRNLRAKKSLKFVEAGAINLLFLRLDDLFPKCSVFCSA